MEIGKAIKAVRKEKGIGQKQLADMCDISVNALSQIETNASFPQKVTLRKISDALNVPINYLVLLSINEDDVSEERKGTFRFLSETMKTVLMDEVKALK
jgi:transcriptional regulator with XRE-family HTH domain